MKKYLFVILPTILFLTPIFAQENLDSTDKAKIDSKINLLISAFNNRDVEIVNNIVLNQEKELIAEIQNKIQEDITLKIDYSLRDGEYEILENGDVKVKGIFYASGSNWDISGFKVNLILREVNNEWYLVDTDLLEKLDSEYVFKIVGKVFLFTIPLLLVFTGFWIWMLMDSIKRDYKEKTLWILLLIFFPISCFIYFFVIKRKYDKEVLKKIYNN